MIIDSTVANDATVEMLPNSYIVLEIFHIQTQTLSISDIIKCETFSEFADLLPCTLFVFCAYTCSLNRSTSQIYILNIF